MKMTSFISIFFILALLLLLTYAIALIFFKEQKNRNFKFWGTITLALSLLFFYIRNRIMHAKKMVKANENNQNTIDKIKNDKIELEKLIDDTSQKIEKVNTEIGIIEDKKNKLQAKKKSSKKYTDSNLDEAVDKLKNL